MATTTYGTPYVSGTDLVANWPAASLTVANSIDAAGYYIGRGNNTQTGSYTTVLTDAGKTITMSNASANTVTIPANSSVAYVIGTRINILNLGAGACTPTAGVGVTISGTITALATNESASLVKTATNTWSYLAAPAPGLSLVTPTSVAGTGVSLSGAVVTVAAATTASVNGCFTSTYANYVVVMDSIVGVTGNPVLNYRLRASGTDTSANYYWAGNYVVFTGATGVNNGSSVAQYELSSMTSTFKSGIFLNVFTPQLAVATGMNHLQNRHDAAQWTAGHLRDTTAYDGFTIFPASSTVSCTIRVYGLRNS